MKKGFKRTFVIGAAFAVTSSLSGCGLYATPPDMQHKELTPVVTSVSGVDAIEAFGLEFSVGDRVVQHVFLDHDEITVSEDTRLFLGKEYKAAISAETGEKILPEVYVAYYIAPYTYDPDEKKKPEGNFAYSEGPVTSDNEWVITRIVIKDPTVTVFGHGIGSDPERIDGTLQFRGFSIEVVGERHVARRDDITIMYGRGEINLSPGDAE